MINIIPEKLSHNKNNNNEVDCENLNLNEVSKTSIVSFEKLDDSEINIDSNNNSENITSSSTEERKETVSKNSLIPVIGNKTICPFAIMPKKNGDISKISAKISEVSRTNTVCFEEPHVSEIDIHSNNNSENVTSQSYAGRKEMASNDSLIPDKEVGNISPFQIMPRKNGDNSEISVEINEISKTNIVSYKKLDHSEISIRLNNNSENIRSPSTQAIKEIVSNDIGVKTTSTLHIIPKENGDHSKVSGEINEVPKSNHISFEKLGDSKINIHSNNNSKNTFASIETEKEAVSNDSSISDIGVETPLQIIPKKIGDNSRVSVEINTAVVNEIYYGQPKNGDKLLKNVSEMNDGIKKLQDVNIDVGSETEKGKIIEHVDEIKIDDIVNDAFMNSFETRDKDLTSINSTNAFGKPLKRISKIDKDCSKKGKELLAQIELPDECGNRCSRPLSSSFETLLPKSCKLNLPTDLVSPTDFNQTALPQKLLKPKRLATTHQFNWKNRTMEKVTIDMSKCKIVKKPKERDSHSTQSRRKRRTRYTTVTTSPTSSIFIHVSNNLVNTEEEITIKHNNSNHNRYLENNAFQSNVSQESNLINNNKTVISDFLEIEQKGMERVNNDELESRKNSSLCRPKKKRKQKSSLQSKKNEINLDEESLQHENNLERDIESNRYLNNNYRNTIQNKTFQESNLLNINETGLNNFPEIKRKNEEPLSNDQLIGEKSSSLFNSVKKRKRRKLVQTNSLRSQKQKSNLEEESLQYENNLESNSQTGNNFFQNEIQSGTFQVGNLLNNNKTGLNEFPVTKRKKADDQLNGSKNSNLCNPRKKRKRKIQNNSSQLKKKVINLDEESSHRTNNLEKNLETRAPKIQRQEKSLPFVSIRRLNLITNLIESDIINSSADNDCIMANDDVLRPDDVAIRIREEKNAVHERNEDGIFMGRFKNEYCQKLRFTSPVTQRYSSEVRDPQKCKNKNKPSMSVWTLRNDEEKLNPSLKMKFYNCRYEESGLAKKKNKLGKRQANTSRDRERRKEIKNSQERSKDALCLNCQRSESAASSNSQHIESATSSNSQRILNVTDGHFKSFPFGVSSPEGCAKCSRTKTRPKEKEKQTDGEHGSKFLQNSNDLPSEETDSNNQDDDVYIQCITYATFPCRNCGKYFSKEANFERHRKICKQARTRRKDIKYKEIEKVFVFPCQFCNSLFKNSKKKKRHELICRKTFKRRLNLPPWPQCCVKTPRRECEENNLTETPPPSLTPIYIGNNNNSETFMTDTVPKGATTNSLKKVQFSEVQTFSENEPEKLNKNSQSSVQNTVLVPESSCYEKHLQTTVREYPNNSNMSSNDYVIIDLCDETFESEKMNSLPTTQTNSPDSLSSCLTSMNIEDSESNQVDENMTIAKRMPFSLVSNSPEESSGNYQRAVADITSSEILSEPRSSDVMSENEYYDGCKEPSTAKKVHPSIFSDLEPLDLSQKKIGYKERNEINRSTSSANKISSCRVSGTESQTFRNLFENTQKKTPLSEKLECNAYKKPQLSEKNARLAVRKNFSQPGVIDASYLSRLNSGNLRNRRNELNDYEEEMHDCEEEMNDCEEEINDCEEEMYDCEEAMNDCEEEMYDCEEVMNNCEEEMNDCEEEMYDCEEEMNDQYFKMASSSEIYPQHMKNRTLMLARKDSDLNPQVQNVPTNRAFKKSIQSKTHGERCKLNESVSNYSDDDEIIILEQDQPSSSSEVYPRPPNISINTSLPAVYKDIPFNTLYKIIHSELNQTINNMIPAPKFYKCNTCGEAYILRSQIYEHSLTHHSNEQFNHSKHTEENILSKFSPQAVSIVYTKPDCLVEKFSNKHCLKTTVASKISSGFMNRGQSQFMQTAPEPNTPKDVLLSKNKRSHLNLSIRNSVNNVVKEYACFKCNRVFEQKSEYRKHYYTEHGNFNKAAKY
ncbi:uncharacterized protein MAL13P1.304-like [Parasteatoda tepidariorum]|uniref:uncharacterized protein MAL13P1.304-like n=1 Tax=Parasteatoda tepidariorum TaxID=114398 RepID=UPI0039BCF726